MRSKRNGNVLGCSLAIFMALAATVGVVGCGGRRNGANAATTQQSIQGVQFQAKTGTKNREILKVGGLTLLGTCRHVGANASSLTSITAKTSVDNAVVSSHFGQQGHGSPTFTFVLDDFDRSYGAWDVLGSNPDETAGTLNYSGSDGAQLALTFVADEGTSQGDCVFGGIASYAP